MGRPIVVNEEHQIKVHQPMVREVIDLGEDEFGNLVLPFVLTTESVFNGVENEDELIEKFHIFDLFFTEVEEGKTILDNVFHGRNSLEMLKESLMYFLRADDIRVLHKMQKLVVNNSYLIDKKEFDRIRKAIQEVCGRKDIQVEKPPKNMTKRQQDVWKKLQRGRKRTAERQAVYVQDMINFVSFGGASYISPKDIEDMNHYYFQNAYKSVVGMDAFRIGMSYKLSQKFDVKDEVKHWTETLKIGK